MACNFVPTTLSHHLNRSIIDEYVFDFVGNAVLTTYVM